MLVVDNTLMYAQNLEEAFNLVVEYLELVGNNGIILNQDVQTVSKTRV